jgi:hypothetical protein
MKVKIEGKISRQLLLDPITRAAKANLSLCGMRSDLNYLPYDTHPRLALAHLNCEMDTSYDLCLKKDRELETLLS